MTPAEVLGDHLAQLGPSVVEPSSAAAEAGRFEQWVAWMDAHVGVIAPGIWVNLIQVALPALVVLVMAFAVLPGRWRDFREHGFDMSRKFRAALTWLVTVLLAPVVLLVVTALLLYAFGAKSLESTHYDFWWVVVVCLVGLVVRLVLSSLTSWQERLGRAWQPVAWGGVLALCGVLVAALWPIHRPLTQGIWHAFLTLGLLSTAEDIHAFFLRLIADTAPARHSASALPATLEGWTHRPGIAELLEAASGPDERYALIDLIASKHLEAGTVPTGEWSGGRPPYFEHDVESSTRLAQFDEKWRGLDR
jgi:hypothetical protein